MAPDGLIARQGRRGKLADGDAGMRSEHAHAAEQRIDLDLDHLDRARRPGADREAGRAAHHEAEDPADHAGVLDQRIVAVGRPRIVFGALRLDLEIGRGCDEFAPRRIRARRRLSSGLLSDAGLQLAGGDEERRHDRRGDPAAAGCRPLGQLRIADADLDLVRIEPEFARDRVGDDAAGAGADVLHCGAATRRPPSIAEFDLGSKLPEIEPIAHRHADAAPVAAGLRLAASAQAPGLKPRRPVVKALPIGIGVPALAQAQSHRSRAEAPPRQSPAQARRPSAGRPERETRSPAAGC